MESIVTKFKLPADAAAALYAWRDTLLVTKAAELKSASDEVESAKLETASVQAAYDLYVKNAKEAITATATAIADTNLDDKDTVQAITAIVVELQTPEVEKQRAAILAKQAELQAELDALG